MSLLLASNQRHFAKIPSILIIFSVFFLTACPANEYNFVIINNSEEVIEIGYEYEVPAIKHDDSRLTEPAIMSRESYEKSEDIEKQWQKLVPEKDYLLEKRKEPYSLKPKPENEEDGLEKTFDKLKIKLQPNQVLRVFNSTGINSDIKRVGKLSVTGKNSSLQIQGNDFQQFTPYRSGGFFKDIIDYRITFGNPAFDIK